MNFESNNNQPPMNPATPVQPPVTTAPTPGYQPQPNPTPNYQPQANPAPGYQPQPNPNPGYQPQANPNPGYQPQGYPNPGYPPQGYPVPEQPKKSKKTLWIVIACIVALLLIFSFAGKDKEVAAVEDLIENIGVVTLDSEDAIQAAEDAYNALPSEKQKKVSNIDDLEKSKDEYTNLVIDAFQSSEYYSKLQNILTTNLAQYNPQMTIDRDKMALVITMAVDSSIGNLLKNYPSLARESWSSVVTNFNSMGSSCYQISSEYKLDTIMQVYSGSTSSTLLLESVNGVTSYNILD